MQRNFRQFLASILLVAIATSASAANQLPFQIPFAFGSLGYAQENDDTFVEGGASIEIGGGLFFSRNVGVFGSYSRSPGGITLPYRLGVTHPDFGRMVLSGTFETDSITTLAFGAFIRRDLNQAFYVLARLGVAYSRQDADILAQSTDPIAVDFETTAEFELTGAMGSAGVGWTINNKLDVTFMYSSRPGDLETKDFGASTTTSEIPNDFQIGFLYKF